MTTSDLTRNPTVLYRLGVLVAIGTALVMVWSVGALGIVGPGGPSDLLFVAALAVGLVGASLARFRAPGMARALGATAATLVLACAAALAMGLQDEEGASAGEIVMVTAFFTVLFAVSAALFARAAQVRDDAAHRGHA
jgi:hypothetical protein